MLAHELRRQSQVDLYEFEAIQVYWVSSRTARTTQRNPVWEKKKKKKKNRKNCHHMSNSGRPLRLVGTGFLLDLFSTPGW
jgi:hypothetical protein